MDNENYFDSQETRCGKLFNEFNEKVKWFDGITANTRLSEIDYKCTDKKGRLTHAELKERRGTLEDFKKYGDILIEPSKLARFTKIAESGHTYQEKRLYINFLDDAVVVYNIDDLRNLIFYPNHQQRNYGKHKVEKEDRIGLQIEEAMIFNKEGIRIQ